MTQTVNRVFPSAADAQAAVNELRELGFEDDAIHVVSPTPSASVEDLTNTIAKCYVLKSYARVYAAAVQRGCTCVVVHAPFGMAGTAIHTLDSFRPDDSVAPERGDEHLAWDDAAPLSSALHMPTIVGDPAPLSSFWGLPVLTSGQGTFFGSMGMPEVSRGPFNGTFGMALLSNNPTPLSSLLGLPVLKKP